MPSSEKLRLALAAALAAAVGSTGCHIFETEQPELWGRQIPLTILHTSDIHSRLLPYDFRPNKTDQDLGLRTDTGPYGGISRIGALIERERARAQRVVHLDSGDCFQGAPIFNANNGEVEVRWLSLMKADAVVVGNHEFDAGVRNLAKQYADWGTYPLLSANYDWYDYKDDRYTELGRLTQPYTIINADGLRIAVIGMANISSLNSIGEEGNSLQVRPLEQNETLRGYVELLSPMVDLVGVVSHLGLDEDKELIEGYEAIYSRSEIRQFLNREKDPWVIDEAKTKEYRLEGDRVVVRIPGVRNVDFIAGGHLHVVTNPPQVLTDPDGRNVVLFHSGAFAKYLGRLDLVVQMPPPPDQATPLERYRGAEIVSHDFYAFPIDAFWCMDHRTVGPLKPSTAPEDAAEFIRRERQTCEAHEHWLTLKLLDEYIFDLATRYDLQRIFAYAPREILRRASAAGGDSPLGNMTAESMRMRRGVEAEFAVTNTLGIRDSLYRGPITIESMFNVFPFENTINIMYLSGEEIQELFEFITDRSAGRGCQSQAMIAGVSFTMDCAQANRNNEFRSCRQPSDCVRSGEPEIEWQCNDQQCWAPAARDIRVGDEPVQRHATYKAAVNDYIAKGGSGFTVLKRNTTRLETGISLRDALIEYMQNSYCTCDALLSDRAKERCPYNLVEERGELVVDPLAVAYCQTARQFDALLREIDSLPEAERDARLLDEDAPRVYAGRCDCNDVLVSDEAHRTAACGQITRDLVRFCQDPTRVPVVTGVEDGRIGRRLQ